MQYDGTMNMNEIPTISLSESSTMFASDDTTSILDHIQGDLDSIFNDELKQEQQHQPQPQHFQIPAMAALDTGMKYFQSSLPTPTNVSTNVNTNINPHSLPQHTCESMPAMAVSAHSMPGMQTLPSQQPQMQALDPFPSSRMASQPLASSMQSACGNFGPPTTEAAPATLSLAFSDANCSKSSTPFVSPSTLSSSSAPPSSFLLSPSLRLPAQAAGSYNTHAILNHGNAAVAGAAPPATLSAPESTAQMPSFLSQPHPQQPQQQQHQQHSLSLASPLSMSLPSLVPSSSNGIAMNGYQHSVPSVGSANQFVSMQAMPAAIRQVASANNVSAIVAAGMMTAASAFPQKRNMQTLRQCQQQQSRYGINSAGKKQQREEARKQRNRKHAKQSRQRRKVELVQLVQQLEHLKAENYELRHEVFVQQIQQHSRVLDKDTIQFVKTQAAKHPKQDTTSIVG